MNIQPIEWVARKRNTIAPGMIRLIDQTLLPGRLVFRNIASTRGIWEAIRSLRVRGAPAIGVAAAMGMILAAQSSKAKTGRGLVRDVCKAAEYLATSRPTAVNLFWALDRMIAMARANRAKTPTQLCECLAREALAIMSEDLATCRAIGEHGLTLLRNNMSVLTHCNAGALATSGYGTALAPLYAAMERGWKMHVFADETRPLLQGARLTAWELRRAGIPATLICDNTAAVVMAKGRVDAVLVGADRIAANGDTANKVGTYGVALLASAHGIPFYVLAPSSTFDLELESGSGIPIEERSAAEVTHGFGKRTAPVGIKVFSPAFDVTPAGLITAIVCESGVLRPPFAPAIRRTFGRLKS